ncbi:MAG TPA: HPF/RaiA family ribosome-associated protein [Nevskia sp.]|nr:HPF/RaiA family ribosome-associated protein [Nevskia sp.]
MQLPLEIDYRNVQSSTPIDTLIRTRASKLSRCCPRLIGCHVTVETPHRHHRHGNAYLVNIRLAVPGSAIAVNRGHDADSGHDLYATIRDAFDVAERQLENWSDKRHEHERPAQHDLRDAG